MAGSPRASSQDRPPSSVRSSRDPWLPYVTVAAKSADLWIEMAGNRSPGALRGRDRPVAEQVARIDYAERAPVPAIPFASRSDHAPRGRISTPVAAAVVAFLATGLATPATVALLAAQGTPMTLKAAYDAGLIMISVEIAAQDKRGDRLLLTIEPSDTPLTITVPAETTTLAMEKPFDVLNFRAPTAQKISLTAEAPAKLVVNQVGERRFVSGKFQIAMDDGMPQFVGSATVDTVKPQ